MKKKWITLVKIAVSIGFIYLVARRLDFNKVAEIFEVLNGWYFLAGLILMFIVALFNTYKWKLLLEVQDIHISYARVLNHYLVGYFFNNFLTGVGEVKRIYDLSQETGKCQQVVASVFVERWTGIITQVAMALVAMGLAYRDIPHIHNVLLVVGALFIGLLILFILLGKISSIPFLDRWEKVHRWLETFRHAYAQYAVHRKSLTAAFALSLAAPVSLIFIHWLLILGFGRSASLWVFVIFIPIIAVFSQVPISINGIGIQELFFVEILGLAGIPPEVSVSVSILSHLLKMGIGAIGGVMFFLRKDRKKIPEEQDATAVCPVIPDTP